MTRGSEKQSVLTILKSILRQLVYDPETCTTTQEALDMYRAANKPDFVTLKQCKTLFTSILKAGIKVRIFIDALDECDEWRELLTNLSELSRCASTPHQFQLLVTGLTHVRVDKKFAMAEKIDVHIARSDSELRHYVIGSIKSCPPDERPVGGNYPALEQRLADTLCRRSGGMFVCIPFDKSALTCLGFFGPSYNSHSSSKPERRFPPIKTSMTKLRNSIKTRFRTHHPSKTYMPKLLKGTLTKVATHEM
jgi:hypothetical protein